MLYGAIQPPRDVNVVLFVPNAPGHMVREKYLKGEGIYGCVSVENDATGNAREIVLRSRRPWEARVPASSRCHSNTSAKGTISKSKFSMAAPIQLMRLCFQVMVDNGYPPSFAYAKAIRSLRCVIDVMDEVGIEEYVSRRCSRTAEFAIRTRGPRVVNEEAIREIFRETERGEFARDWMQEWALGMPTLYRQRRTAAEGTMEKTGHDWRRDFGK